MIPAMQRSLIAAIVLLLMRPAAAADADVPSAASWKLTLGHYFYTTDAGDDLNLRWQRGDTHAWAGLYRDPSFGSQLRAGIDGAVNLGRHAQLQPSLQVATQGFVGGSLTLQAGDAWFGLAGIGRTNLRPYFNLNFDPNDAVTVGVGHRSDAGNQYSLYVVTDDRLHTRQRHYHLLARIPLGSRRLTIDVLRKSGLGDTGPVSGWGLSVTCDWPRWFLRAAEDPHQNFSTQNALRLAAGLRW
jgi:hypothetical protein